MVPQNVRQLTQSLGLLPVLSNALANYVVSRASSNPIQTHVYNTLSLNNWQNADFASMVGLAYYYLDIGVQKGILPQQMDRAIADTIRKMGQYMSVKSIQANPQLRAFMPAEYVAQFNSLQQEVQAIDNQINSIINQPPQYSQMPYSNQWGNPSSVYNPQGMAYQQQGISQGMFTPPAQAVVQNASTQESKYSAYAAQTVSTQTVPTQQVQPAQTTQENTMAIAVPYTPEPEKPVDFSIYETPAGKICRVRSKVGNYLEAIDTTLYERKEDYRGIMIPDGPPERVLGVSLAYQIELGSVMDRQHHKLAVYNVPEIEKQLDTMLKSETCSTPIAVYKDTIKPIKYDLGVASSSSEFEAIALCISTQYDNKKKAEQKVLDAAGNKPWYLAHGSVSEYFAVDDVDVKTFFALTEVDTPLEAAKLIRENLVVHYIDSKTAFLSDSLLRLDQYITKKVNNWIAWSMAKEGIAIESFIADYPDLPEYFDKLGAAYVCGFQKSKQKALWKGIYGKVALQEYEPDSGSDQDTKNGPTRVVCLDIPTVLLLAPFTSTEMFIDVGKKDETYAVSNIERIQLAKLIYDVKREFPEGDCHILTRDGVKYWVGVSDVGEKDIAPALMRQLKY